MLKKIIIVLLVVLSVSGISYLLYKSGKRDGVVLCKGVKIDIDKPQGASLFMSDEEILSELKQKGFRLKGNNIDSINTSKLENELNQNPLFSDAQVLSSKATGNIIIKLKQKFPQYMVQMNDTLYYVGENRKFIPVNIKYMANVPVVTGDIDTIVATETSYSLMEKLKRDSALYKSLGQVYYDKSKGFILLLDTINTPIIIGDDTTQWQDIIHKIHIFLDKIEPKMGWGRIKYVNMSYKDQIVVGDKFLNKKQNKDEYNNDYE